MTPGQIVVVLLAAVVASLVKALLGSGYPLILVPAIALFLTVEDAVVIVAPANVALNLVIAYELRRYHDRSSGQSWFVASAVLGAAIGTLLLPVLPDRALRLTLVIVIGLFVVNRLRRVERNLAPATARRFTPIVGGIAGLFQGAAGVSGPIVAPWYLSLGLDRETFVYSVTVVYGLSSGMQLLVISTSGLFTTERLVLGLVLVPLSLAVTPAGSRLRGRIQPVLFERLVIGVLVLSAISLVIRSL